MYLLRSRSVSTLGGCFALLGGVVRTESGAAELSGAGKHSYRSLSPTLVRGCTPAAGAPQVLRTPLCVDYVSTPLVHIALTLGSTGVRG